MPNKNLKLTDIIADDRYQGRVSLDETVVAEYAALLKADTDPWPFEDPCDVVEIDSGHQVMISQPERLAAVLESL